MPTLSFISDQDLEESIHNLLVLAHGALEQVELKFNKNVIDPFSAIFEMAGFKINEDEWKMHEQARKAQKTLSNHIGSFHQAILGKVKGWKNPGPEGMGVDLVSAEHKVIAEIKNKHNTVKGSDLAKLYAELENYVDRKTSMYKDYTAYYVEIVPKKPKRYDVPFTPSDRSMGRKKPEHHLIRKIDGYSFYKLVTGVDDALLQLFKALPEVIQANKQAEGYKFSNTQFLDKFFEIAFGNNV